MFADFHHEPMLGVYSRSTKPWIQVHVNPGRFDLWVGQHKMDTFEDLQCALLAASLEVWS